MRRRPRSSATCCSCWSTSARRRGIEAEAAVRAANAKFRRRFGSVERGAAAQGVALRDLDFAALDALWDAAKAEREIRRQMTHRQPAANRPGRRTRTQRPATHHLHPRRPEVGRGLVPDPGRRYRGAVRRDHRRPRPAAPARQGHRLGHSRVFDAPAGHRRAHRPRVGQGSDRRPDARDPAAHRALAARRGRSGSARRADDHGRLRRAAGRRRDPHGVDHRWLRGSRRCADHVRHGAPPGGPRSRRSRSASSTGCRTSTSTTPRTRGRTSTSTSSGRTRGRISSSRGRPRASRSTARLPTGCSTSPMVGSLGCSRHKAAVLATVRR